MTVVNFSMLKVYKLFQKELKEKDNLTLKIPLNSIDNNKFNMKIWTDLAEIFNCKLLVPKINNKYLELEYKKLNLKKSFHTDKIIDKTEKYGINSRFFTLNKLNHPYFLHTFINSLEFANFKSRKNILNLGINKGDEFELIKELAKNEFKNLTLTGIDHSKTAIEYAKKVLDYPNCKFYCHDITKMNELNLPKQDLIISISTLQSPQINYKPFLSSLIHNHLKENGALIIAFPNGRWIEDTLIYGARVKNYKFSELGVMCSDIVWSKKYLQQKKFKVAVTGKEYIFITAVKG